MPRAALKKVLIVDDERDLAEPLARRLVGDGRFEVEIALDGADGARKARLLRPDAILLDLAMPEMDGWQLTGLLRADPRTRGATIIMMTAWLSPDLGRRAAAAGVSRLLLKPFQEADLMDALGAAI